MIYIPDIHHRRSIRLREYDYASIGAYFVTICVHGRECLLGRIEDDEMRLNDSGRMVENSWLTLKEKFSHVALDAYVTMPNHFHGIVLIVGAPLAAPGFESQSENKGAASGAPTDIPRFQFAYRGAACRALPRAPTLGNIMRVFKSMSAVSVNRLTDRNGCPLWQRNYHERVIRNEAELAVTREYIESNPAKWANDAEHP